MSLSMVLNLGSGLIVCKNATRTLNSEVSWVGAGVRVHTLWVFLNDISVLLGNFPQNIALSVVIL